MIIIPHPTLRSLALSIALCATLSVFSQVSIGNRAGVSWSQFTFTGNDAPSPFVEQLNDETKALVGFTAAVPVEIQFADHFALQPEVGYLMQGWTTGPSSAENQVRLNYGQLNVLAKATFGRGRLRAFAQAGPSWSMLLSARSLIRDRDNDRLIADGTVHENLDPFNPSTWSVMAGGGLVFKKGGVRLFLDYRYMHGVTEPMQDAPFVDITGNVIRTLKSRSKAHLITLGILIPLGPSEAAALIE